MSSSVTWVCFECRAAVRRNKFGDRSAVHCPDCGRPCVCLGDKIAVPRKTATVQWRTLEKSVREQRHATTEAKHEDSVRRRHELEREIVELESRPTNPGRAGLLRRLRRELAQLKDA